jgi:acyl carrier protein
VTASNELVGAVRGVVERVSGEDRARPLADRDTRLADGYWLDSVDLFKLVLACETEFDVAFDADEDFSPRTFETLGTLANLIHRKQLARGRAS